jgi:hypothetical protein
MAAGCITLSMMLKLSKKKPAASGRKPVAKRSGRKPSSPPQVQEWGEKADLEIASALAGSSLKAIPKLSSTTKVSK